MLVRRRAPNTTTAKSRKRRDRRAEERCIRNQKKHLPIQEKAASDVSSDSPGFTQCPTSAIRMQVESSLHHQTEKREKENLG